MSARAVVHTSEPPREHVLVVPDELALLESVKRALESLDGVHVDPAYRYTVRAFRIDADGRRTALEPGDVRAAVAVLSEAGRVSVVRGAAQTDFTVAGIDKGKGVAELAGRLSDDSEHLALAVGDTEADLSMLRLAHLAFAPANAQPSLRRSDIGVQVVRAPYQAGLALAVERLIGHAPGACARCRPPSLAPEAKLVLDILSAQERGRLGIARRFLALHASTRAPGKSRRP